LIAGSLKDALTSRPTSERVRPHGQQIDPDTGAILRTIESNRFVTGVTWVDGELWHGTWEGEGRPPAQAGECPELMADRSSLQSSA
jgi:hypothetical protein